MPPKRRTFLHSDVIDDVPASTLTCWNLAMAAFHTAFAVVTLAVGNVDLTVPVYKTVLDFRRSNGNTTWELVPHYAPAGELPFTVLVALFFALSALFHLLNATLLRRRYLWELARCRTPTRWIEYTFSAPLMMLLIAYTLGVRDRATLFSVALLVATTMFFGHWTEVAARPASPDAWKTSLCHRLVPWFLGHVPQVAAWLLVLLQFYDGQFDAADRAPAFVHVILWLELLLFFSFGVAALWSQRVPPRRFYVGELCFQVLSLVSKGLLGSLLLVNVLMLSAFDDIYEAA